MTEHIVLKCYTIEIMIKNHPKLRQKAINNHVSPLSRQSKMQVILQLTNLCKGKKKQGGSKYIIINFIIILAYQ